MIEVQSRTSCEDLIKEKDKEIERLIAESTEWESKCYKYQDIIKEVREWIRIVQTNEDRKHLEPIINTDELDHILEILDKAGDEK